MIFDSNFTSLSLINFILIYSFILFLSNRQQHFLGVSWWQTIHSISPSSISLSSISPSSMSPSSILPSSISPTSISSFSISSCSISPSSISSFSISPSSTASSSFAPSSISRSFNSPSSSLFHHPSYWFVSCLLLLLHDFDVACCTFKLNGVCIRERGGGTIYALVLDYQSVWWR